MYYIKFISEHRDDTCRIYSEIGAAVEERTGGGLHMDLTKILAELEREVYNMNYLRADVLKEYLKILNSYSVDELYRSSKYDRLSIERIVNYWKGIE